MKSSLAFSDTRPTRDAPCILQGPTGNLGDYISSNSCDEQSLNLVYLVVKQEDVVGRLGKRDLAAFALTSKETYPAANRLLYSTLELSFCRCSESYYESLARTLTDHPELAALVTHLFIDMKVPCRIKAATSFDDLHPSRIFRPVSLIIAMSDHGRYTPMGQVDWNKEALQSLSNPNASDILAQLYNVEKLTVSDHDSPESIYLT